MVEHWSEKPGVDGSIPSRGIFYFPEGFLSMNLRKILVADDEPAILEMLCVLLTSSGYKSIPASDGGEALKLALKELPSLILLDINMPVMDGLDVCRKLKETPATASIPVIMLTALDSADEVDKALSYGAFSYITKPAAPDEILKAVSSVII